MLTHLADISIRGLLLIAVAAIAILALRRHRTPALQHAIWTAVLLGMLALFTLGETLPRLPLRVLNATPSQNSTTEAIAVSESVVSLETRAARPVATKATHSNIDWTTIATDLYALIAAAFAIRFLLGMLLVRRLLAQSTSVDNFRESELIGIPVTAGWLRPVVVLPKEWREWNRAKLEAVLTHERAHVRRKDNLIAGLAGLNRCLLWFNPLAWWLERRLALLAEQACDEASILALGGTEDEREDYVRLLLDMTATLNASHGRLRTHVLAMANRSQIRRRIEPLLQQRRAFSGGVNKAASATLAICCIPVVWATGSIDLAHQAAQLHLDVPHFAIAIPQVPEQKPQLIAQSTVPGANDAARPAPAPDLKFEVASVKVHEMAPRSFMFRQYPPGGPPQPFKPTGNRWTWRGHLQDLVMEAYGVFDYQMSGVPDWGQEEFGTVYDIDAKSPGDGTPANDQLRQMLRSLLADRFQLHLHRETSALPVYALAIGNNGSKLRELPDEEELPRGRGDPSAPTQKGNFTGLFNLIKIYLDRPLIDETGITGKYEAPGMPWDQLAEERRADPMAAQNLLFAAVQDKLGLKLEARRQNIEVLVIDHVEQPSPN